VAPAALVLFATAAAAASAATAHAGRAIDSVREKGQEVKTQRTKDRANFGLIFFFFFFFHS
jgi:hypothetical protein